jgi:hypothetical protein
MRPADVNSPAGGVPPTGPEAAISVIGSLPSLIFPGFILFGALGNPIFKFVIDGRRKGALSTREAATSFFS